MCDCFKIGGPWIAEDPDCPVHGTERVKEDTREEEKIQALVEALENIRDYRSDVSDEIAARSMRFYAEEALKAFENE